MHAHLENGRIVIVGPSSRVEALRRHVPGLIMQRGPRPGSGGPVTATAPAFTLGARGVLLAGAEAPESHPDALDKLAVLAERAERFRARIAAPVSLESAKALSRNLGLQRDLLPHQAQAVLALEEIDYRGLLADDMGLGKTMAALACFASIRRNVDPTATLLIVCPASVKWNWKREVELALGSEIRVGIIDGTPTQRQAIFDRLAARDFEAVIVNYDLLHRGTPAQTSALNAFADHSFVVCDESHYLKDCESARARAVQAWKPARILLMSGTPIRNTVMDLFAQLDLLIPKLWFNKWIFRGQFCRVVMIDYGRRKVPKIVGTQNVEQLNAIVQTVQVRRKKGDVLDLPEKLRTSLSIDLDDLSARVYESMREDWLYQFADEVDPMSPRAKSAIEQCLRLEQIAQGVLGGVPPSLRNLIVKESKHFEPIPGREGELAIKSSAKVAWLLETIQTLISQERPPVVWFKFNSTLFWVQHLLEQEGIAPAVLHGALSSTQKGEAIAAFDRGEGHCFLGQVKMAEGFNLLRSSDVIFFGLDWSHAINAQAEDRCHRIGQKRCVSIWVPTMRGTFETYVAKRVAQKDADAEQALSPAAIAAILRGEAV